MVWCDALHVVEGVQHLLDGEELCLEWNNLDLWRRISAVVAQLPVGVVRCRHVPGHLDVHLCEGPFEEWLAKYNGMADTQAVFSNRNRPWQFQRLHATAAKWDDDTKRAIRALRHIYFKIAETSPSQVDHEIEDPAEIMPAPQVGAAEDVAERIELWDQVPVCWQQIVQAKCREFPAFFVTELVEWVLRVDSLGDLRVQVTWLELIFMNATTQAELAFKFPVTHPSTGKWVAATEVLFAPPRLTAAVQLRVVRSVLKNSFRALGLGALLVSSVDLTCWGVAFGCEGAWIHCSSESLQRARELLIGFAARRPIRTQADLARPIL